MLDENRRFRYSAAFQLDNSSQRPTESVPYENYQPCGRITEHTQHSCTSGNAIQHKTALEEVCSSILLTFTL